MPSIDAYVNPRFVPYQPSGWTLTRLTQDRYMRFDNQRRYRNVGQGYILNAGYSAGNPSITPIRVATNTETVKLRPQIVDRYAT